MEENANAVALFIARHGLTLKASPMPFRLPVREGGLDAWDKDALHFAVEITAQDGKAILWRGCYSVGTGLADDWARKSGKTFLLEALRTIRDVPRSLAASEARASIRAAFHKAAPLRLHDVLHSLQMDVSSVEDGFEDWAANCGLDPDSRKALATYEVCAAIRADLRRVLGYEALAEFQQLDFDAEV